MSDFWVNQLKKFSMRSELIFPRFALKDNNGKRLVTVFSTVRFAAFLIKTERISALFTVKFAVEIKMENVIEIE